MASYSATVRWVTPAYFSSAGRQMSDSNTPRSPSRMAPVTTSCLLRNGTSDGVPLRSPGDEAEIGTKWERALRYLTRQDAHALAVHDLALVGHPRGRVRPHLGDRQPEPKLVAELHPVQQQDVVDERAHGVLAGDGCHPQDLGVFVIVDGRHLMLFHQRDHRVKEVAKDPHGGSECGAIGGQAVDDDARRLEVFDHLLDLVEMAIDLNLLRRIVLDTNHSSRDLRLELDPETLGVPLDLSRRLVQAEHETSLAAPRALGDVLQTHHALADAGDPHDQRGAPEEVSAVDDLVEARHTRRNPRLGIEGRGQFTRPLSRRLYTPVYLETVAINDPEGMTPHFKLMTARLHHVDRSTDRAVDVVNAEHHDRVRNEPFDRRCRQTNAFETRRFNGQHRGDILTMQSLHKHVKHFTRAP